MSDHEIHLVRVFAASEGGGNPAPIILHADGLSDNEMRSIAGEYGHESAFVLRPEHTSHTFRFRFFVPNHEMEMCGHATLGALWLLRKRFCRNKDDGASKSDMICNAYLANE
jgi:trans-2,3-dihydro-3-hydroxyanthranilate isomerase